MDTRAPLARTRRAGPRGGARVLLGARAAPPRRPDGPAARAAAGRSPSAVAGAAALVALAALARRGSGRGRLGLARALVLLLVAAARCPGVAGALRPAAPRARGRGARRSSSSRTRRLPPRRVLLPVVVRRLRGRRRCACQEQVGPQGDEPHYLMVADSLLRDDDLALEQDYAEGRYRASPTRTLAPHYRVRGRDGAIYSLHAVGLSLLVLPAYALGGYAGVSFFMALARRAAGARGPRAAARSRRRRAARPTASRWLARAVARRSCTTPGSSSPRSRRRWCSPSRCAAWPAPARWRARTLVAGRCRSRSCPGSTCATRPWPRSSSSYALAARPAARGRPSRWPRPPPSPRSALGAVPLRALRLLRPAARLRAPARVLAGDAPRGAARACCSTRSSACSPTRRVFALCRARASSRLGARPRRGSRPSALALVAGRRGATAGSWHMWRGGFNPPARFLVPVAARARARRRRARCAAASGAAARAARGLEPLDGRRRGVGPARSSTATATAPRRSSARCPAPRSGRACCPATCSRSRRPIAAGSPLVWARRPRRPRSLRAAAVAPTAARARRRPASALLVAAGVASRAVRARARAAATPCASIGRPALAVPGLARRSRGAGGLGTAGRSAGGRSTSRTAIPTGAGSESRLPLPPGRYRLDLDGGARSEPDAARLPRGPAGAAARRGT